MILKIQLQFYHLTVFLKNYIFINYILKLLFFYPYILKLQIKQTHKNLFGRGHGWKEKIENTLREARYGIGISNNLLSIL